MKVNPSIFCKQAIEILDKSSNFAEDFVRLKFEFFREYQSPYIFSTRFGADFFSKVYEFLISDKYLELENDWRESSPLLSKPILGEFDKNFNTWLKTARTIK